MQNVVLVPGIFGTRMLRAGDGFELWPPIGQAVAMDTDTRAVGLIDPATSAADILEGIRILPAVGIPEYSPITDFLESLPATNLIRFPYDWRVDLRTTADVLADRLDLVDDGPILLVAHSMGGLICRYLLESGQYAQSKWFSRVRQLVCIAVPHLGAPLSVFRVLGREGMSGFVFPGSAMGILGSVPDRFPAGHQLLPSGTVSCVRLASGMDSSVGNAFPEIAASGLNASAGLHTTLDRFRRPSSVLYRFIYGHGHVDGNGNRDTTVGIMLDDRGRMGHAMGDGDGTVPFWSALPSGPTGFIDDQFGVVGEHVGMLADPTVLQRLDDWISPRFV